MTDASKAANMWMRRSITFVVVLATLAVACYVVVDRSASSRSESRMRSDDNLGEPGRLVGRPAPRAPDDSNATVVPAAGSSEAALAFRIAPADSGRVVGVRVVQDRPDAPRAAAAAHYGVAWVRRFAETVGEDSGKRELPVRVERDGDEFTVRMASDVLRASGGRPASLLAVLPDGNPITLLDPVLLPPEGNTVDLGVLRIPEVRHVRGTVLDPLGRPLEGAAVSLRPGGELTWVEDATGNVAAAVRTDSDGKFLLPVPGDHAAVLVYHPDHAPRFLPSLSSDQQGLIVRLQPAAPISGSVKLLPNSDLGVSLALEGISHGSSQLRRHVVVDLESDGTFFVKGVGAGVYALSLRIGSSPVPQQSQPFEHSGAAPTVLASVVFHADTRVILVDQHEVLEAGDELTLRGVGRGEGGTSGLDVALHWPETGSPRLEVRLMPGVWDLIVFGPSRLGSVFARVRDLSLSAGQGVEALLSFDLSPATRIRLSEAIDRGADPPELSKLAYANVTYSFIGLNGQARGEAKADHGGAVDLRCPSEVVVDLTVELPGVADRLAWQGRLADLPEGELVFHTRRRELRIQVTDNAGNPLGGVLVQALKLHDPADRSVRSVVREAWSDDDGICVLGALTLGGRYRLGYRFGGVAASSNAFIPLQPHEISFDADTPGTIRGSVPGPRTTGRVRDSGGFLGCTRLRIRAIKSDGVLAFVAQSQPFTSDTGGGFVLDGVPPGRYRLEEVDGRGRRARMSEVFEIPDESAEVLVVFP